MAKATIHVEDALIGGKPGTIVTVTGDPAFDLEGTEASLTAAQYTAAVIYKAILSQPRPRPQARPDGGAAASGAN